MRRACGRIQSARFRQGHGGPGQHGQTRCRGADEDRFPSERGIEQAADQRAQRGKHHHDRCDEPHHRRGAVAVEQIADDGAPDHDAGRSADRLQDARDNEAADIRHDDGEETGRGGQREAREQHRPPSEAIGKRPHQKLACRERKQIDRDGELDDRNADVEPRRQLRQGRHQDVERGRTDGGHRHQQDRAGPKAGRCLRCRRAAWSCSRFAPISSTPQPQARPSGRVAASSHGRVLGVHQRSERIRDAGVVGVEPGYFLRR